MLWLWKMHNRVNMRLSGDITDDVAFPKEKFPNKQHCTDCYNNKLGFDLTSEFRLKTVETFLKTMYSELNYSGLDLEEYTGKVMGASAKHINPKHPPKPHDLMVKPAAPAAAAAAANHVLDKSNYDRVHNESWTVMSKTDASLSFVVYFVSAAILAMVYMKFIARRRLSPCFSAICPRSRTSSPANPLLGKV